MPKTFVKAAKIIFTDDIARHNIRKHFKAEVTHTGKPFSVLVYHINRILDLNENERNKISLYHGRGNNG
jgi:hypothetical protein